MFASSCCPGDTLALTLQHHFKLGRELILNYGGKPKGSITDNVYNRYEYDAEKGAGLELWADALDAIIGLGPAEIEDYHARLARLKGGEKIRLGQPSPVPQQPLP